MVIKRRNLMDGVKNILDSLEHRISKLEDRTKENTQSEVYSL